MYSCVDSFASIIECLSGCKYCRRHHRRWSSFFFLLFFIVLLIVGTVMTTTSFTTHTLKSFCNHMWLFIFIFHCNPKIALPCHTIRTIQLYFLYVRPLSSDNHVHILKGWTCLTRSLGILLIFVRKKRHCELWNNDNILIQYDIYEGNAEVHLAACSLSLSMLYSYR